jgi:hypothetical protein
MPEPHADRNLLFGILALQNDLVSRDELLEAMNAWVLAKHRPLGDILRERGALGADEQALLDALLDRHVRRHGGAEQSLAALSSASAVKHLLTRLPDADAQASLARLGSGPSPAELTGPYVPSDGVRHRVLRPHAKGGLGEVFVAEDTELHRQDVARSFQCPHVAAAGGGRLDAGPHSGHHPRSADLLSQSANRVGPIRGLSPGVRL